MEAFFCYGDPLPWRNDYIFIRHSSKMFTIHDMSSSLFFLSLHNVFDIGIMVLNCFILLFSLRFVPPMCSFVPRAKAMHFITLPNNKVSNKGSFTFPYKRPQTTISVTAAFIINRQHFHFSVTKNHLNEIFKVLCRLQSRHVSQYSGNKEPYFDKGKFKTSY